MARFQTETFPVRILRGFRNDLDVANYCDTVNEMLSSDTYIIDTYNGQSDGIVYDVPIHETTPGTFWILNVPGQTKWRGIAFDKNGVNITGSCPNVSTGYDLNIDDLRPPATSTNAMLTWLPPPPDSEDFADDGDGDDTTTEEGLFDFGGKGGAGLIGWRSSNLISINRLLVAMGTAAAHDYIRNRSNIF